MICRLHPPPTLSTSASALPASLGAVRRPVAAVPESPRGDDHLGGGVLTPKEMIIYLGVVAYLRIHNGRWDSRYEWGTEADRHECQDRGTRSRNLCRQRALTDKTL